MNFNFFTFGGRFLWEDVFNYQNWTIQCNIRNQKYRLLDSHNIRRASGTFNECKNTLLKYIEAYELNPIYDDTVILLHNFCCTKHCWKNIADSLQPLNANIIAVNYASLYKDLSHHAHLLVQFLRNLDNKGKLYFITSGAGCLVLRKLLATCENYRAYHIANVLDINPINSGSDLADLVYTNRLCQKVFGPMLTDLIPQKAISLAKIPQEIPHGIIFYAPSYTQLVKKMLSHFESFPPLSPPSESSYADKICTVKKYKMFPLNDKELGEICLYYLQNGEFPKLPENKNTD